ncbi:fimbrin [Histomonas meleagridis]|uniref:fimbrin n=1 Tax=Histomonas meleagridis TaxID=135588 RepID=UPI00355AA3BD|nr:fimbrin [Histomonas meleagridis]KAH0800838.1 fimbrin [Histomonas meleagridis]
MPVNANEYIPKYPQLTPDEILMYSQHFNSLDADDSGKLGITEIMALFKSIQVPATRDEVKKYIEEVDIDGDGLIDFGEFLTIFIKEKESGASSKLSEGLKKQQNLIKAAGARGEHAYPQEEVTGFVNYLNQELGEDPALQHILPIDPEGDALFTAVQDGILMCKLVNLAAPDTIHDKVIALPPKLNQYKILENCTLAINSAKSIGMSTVNIGPHDIREGVPHLVLGLTWQLIRESLLKDIQLTVHPELFRLLKPGETIEDLLKLKPEEILLRWLNYHLENAGSQRRATNFTKDLSDSEILTTVLKQIAPECCTMAPMRESDLSERAELMLQEADKIECRKFVTPREIVRGHPKLNLAFVANIFNTRPGLEPLSEAELAQLDEALFAAQGTRIERQFCLWMNSCGVDPFVSNLADGVKDGLVLLQMLDKLEPGCVNWKQVSTQKMNKFKAVQNNDYVVKICKETLGLSVVNISGADINDGNTKLILAVMWQMMRYDYLKTFKKLGGGAKIKDEQIVAWANEKTAGKCEIKSFKDDAISDSKPILTLIDVLKPETVDWSIYDSSGEPEMMARNAKYVLSMVRKFGGTVYALPEDIVEHVPEMVMTVYASLMAIAEQ